MVLSIYISLIEAFIYNEKIECIISIVYEKNFDWGILKFVKRPANFLLQIKEKWLQKIANWNFAVFLQIHLITIQVLYST